MDSCYLVDNGPRIILKAKGEHSSIQAKECKSIPWRPKVSRRKKRNPTKVINIKLTTDSITS